MSAPHRRYVRLRAAALASALALGTLVPACAGMIAEEVHIEFATASYVFPQHPSVVLSAAQDVLFASGYMVSAANPNSLETRWKTSNEGERRSRRLVRVEPTPEGTRLTAMIAHQALDNDGDWWGSPVARDAYFELQVIELLDASAAARIRVDAFEARQQARK
ncbi:MAG: hypothetical protein AAF721_14445 [Myxococcota bacterium]